MAIVTVNPGDNLGAIESANVAGSTFNFNPGTYRMQKMVPKSGNIYQPVGTARLAILIGSRILTGWTSDGAGHWYVGGQTQQGTFNPNYNCQDNHPGCPYPEQLWVDDVLYEHVTSLAAMGANKWFFDYAADRIYILIDPTGRVIETSVIDSAFESSATNVTIKGLVVEKYANPAQSGAINLGNGALVENCESRYNHGIGIRTGGSSTQRSNYVHHNGQMGMSASGQNVRILNNEIAYNNTAYFGPGVYGEYGGCKFVATTDALIQGNWSHHNVGSGLWCDINNIRAIYENNIVEDNTDRGIFDEVGYGSIIRNNTIRRNGLAPVKNQGAVAAAGIVVSSCRDVEVYGNLLENNAHGICAQETDRPTPTPPTGYGPHDTVNLRMHDNTVRQQSGRAAGIADQDATADPYTAAANNKWIANHYEVPAGVTFRWTGNVDMTWAQWQAAGQDVGGTLGPPSTIPALNRGEWFYDLAAKTLYVRCTDGLSPATKRMVVFDWRFGMEEIIMVRPDGTLLGRLCRHNSFVADIDVNVDPGRGGSVSYDGSRVAFGSNWGGAATMGVYVALTDPSA